MLSELWNSEEALLPYPWPASGGLPSRWWVGRGRQAEQLGRSKSQSISGLVVEYIVAIDVTQVRFPADALLQALCLASTPLGPASHFVTHEHTSLLQSLHWKTCRLSSRKSRLLPNNPCYFPQGDKMQERYAKNAGSENARARRSHSQELTCPASTSRRAAGSGCNLKATLRR